jgi:prevent-host-death family protein
MKGVGIAALKAKLSSYLKQVKAGREVIITEHGLPVAKIVPISAGDADSRRQQLIRAGIMIPGRGRIPASFFTTPPPLLPGGPKGESGVLAALLAEREEGR